MYTDEIRCACVDCRLVGHAQLTNLFEFIRWRNKCSPCSLYELSSAASKYSPRTSSIMVNQEVTICSAPGTAFNIMSLLTSFLPLKLCRGIVKIFHNSHPSLTMPTCKCGQNKQRLLTFYASLPIRAARPRPLVQPIVLSRASHVHVHSHTPSSCIAEYLV